jgi:hypothetical protein
MICYICKKIIKSNEQYIGKNLRGLDLFKHKKCKSYKLSEKELEEVKNWKSYPEIKGKK